MSAANDPLDEAAQAVARRARRYAPWSVVIFAIATVAYVHEEVAQPLYWSALSDGHYTLGRALGHVRGNLETSTATIPLLWGLWELNAFIRLLAQDGLWSAQAGRRLARVGVATALAGLVAMLIVPAIASLPDARGAKPWPFDPIDLALAGLGVMLVLVARILQIAVRSAERLKQENDQFI